MTRSDASEEGDLASTRLDSYLRAFAGNARSPSMGFYPGLSALPWHDPARFAIVAALEGAYEVILDEINALPGASFDAERERIARTGSWDVAMFYERGYKNISVCAACPATTRVLRGHRTVRSLCGAIYVSRMRPGTHVGAHRGPTNMRLRCHLALQLPSGGCAIRVDNETRSWQEGRCLIFDDSFEHEAWNHGTQDRMVLVVDVWHPDLTDHEITMLEGLQRYATSHASSLSRYWAMGTQA